MACNLAAILVYGVLPPIIEHCGLLCSQIEGCSSEILDPHVTALELLALQKSFHRAHSALTWQAIWAYNDAAFSLDLPSEAGFLRLSTIQTRYQKAHALRLTSPLNLFT